MKQNIDLKKFCGPDVNHQLREPFSEGAYTYATNGRFLIRVPRIPEITATRPDCVKLEKLVFGVSEKNYKPLLAYPEPKKERCGICKGSGRSTECEECEGEGLIEWSTSCNEYEAECKSCHGDGRVSGSDELCPYCDGSGEIYGDRFCFVPVSKDRGLNIPLLEKLKTLEGLLLGELNKNDSLIPFSFNGGDGVVMTQYTD